MNYAQMRVRTLAFRFVAHAARAMALIAAAFTIVGEAAGSCQLNSSKGNVGHVIYIQFDGVHFARDNPNVPSDLEQMPHLLNFVTVNGALLTNHHTALIANTATDMLTSLTGVYGDRHGMPISNSFRYFNPNGTTGVAVSFAYWTSPLFDPSTLTPADTQPNLLSADRRNAPAPWVPYTRAGCNFGAIGMPNVVLENTSVDVGAVFGPASAQAQEAQADPAQAFADFVGVAVHCAAGDALCSAANLGEPDVLPGEPGGYSGFGALYGHKYVAPQISPGGPLTDLNGDVIGDPQGHVGFPGSDGLGAAVSLAYVASMQEHGIPVTYAYISDAHDAHPAGPAYGPGEAGYVAALAAYDDAFDKFLRRLAADGIDQTNTLFVITADEGDRFVGGPPSPAGCDGVSTPCSYAQIGELNANLAGLLATQQGITTPFRVHSDSAPAVYITGNPARDDQTVTRPFERAVGKLTATNPITGSTDALTRFLADPVELRLLHMVTADPARTPTFVMFGNPDYFLFAGAANCASPCVTQIPGFAWNHGDLAAEINTTWLGMVGPGVDRVGVDGQTWSDHTDIRPTVMLLLGLKDAYVHDGRVLSEDLQGWALPKAMKSGGNFVALSQMYKRINAPTGRLGVMSACVSTVALESGTSADDSQYANLESALSSLTDQRNSLASTMIELLDGAEFNGQAIGGKQAIALIGAGQSLLDQASRLATCP